MSLPKPEPGLVIRYSYLWHREFKNGQEEGAKDRPCAIVIALNDAHDETQVLVVPVTHSPPYDLSNAMELPLSVKAHLGLDAERSWIVISESNLFNWPGPDLRRIQGSDDASVAYGFLPPRFFNEMKKRFLQLETKNRSRRIGRTE